MAFTPEQQYRQTFIEEWRQKACGAACHAEWISGQAPQARQ
jgi:hypothetical protein